MDKKISKIRASELLPITGLEWDHEGKSELVQIFISYDDRGIHFLQFLYYENGKLHLTPRPLRCSAGSKFKMIKLNYPEERLTSITGTHIPRKGGRITSLTFTTNKNNCYGPFGYIRPVDPEFIFDLGEDWPFDGFHGSNYEDGMLESFGVYVKPYEPN
ncbi:hypothetical protein NMG60_11032968 [Bertholletia excelsa]